MIVEPRSWYHGKQAKLNPEKADTLVRPGCDGMVVPVFSFSIFGIDRVQKIFSGLEDKKTMVWC